MTARGTVLVAGGGTAGHVFPALAVAGELEASGWTPEFVGTTERLEGRLVPAAGHPLHHIDAVALPRRPTLDLLRLPGRLRSLRDDCVRLIDETGAVGAITFGGYVSFPLSWACRKRDLPLVLHEQNAVPGVANRVAARFADRVALTYAGSAHRFPRPEATVVTGNPVRADFLTADLDEARTRTLEEHDLEPGVATLLVFGGSQGARRVNEAIVAAAALWPRDVALQVLHATGRELHDEATAAWERARVQGGDVHFTVRCVPFLDDMVGAYAAADVVVCRAGATSIAELTVVGRPAVLVPYPHATADHQTANAEALARAGGAIVVPDAELDAQRLVGAVLPWVRDPEQLERVRRSSLAFGRRDAAVLVARQLTDLLEELRS